MREDTRSTTEVGAARAEYYRAQRAGEDTAAPGEFAGSSTWDPASVPEALVEYSRVASASDSPPF